MKECSGCQGTGCWMCHEPEDTKVMLDKFEKVAMKDSKLNHEKIQKELEKINQYDILLKKLSNPPTKYKWFEMELKWNDGYEAEIILDDVIDLKLHRMLVEHFNFLIVKCEENLGKIMRNK